MRKPFFPPPRSHSPAPRSPLPRSYLPQWPVCWHSTTDLPRTSRVLRRCLDHGHHPMTATINYWLNMSINLYCAHLFCKLSSPHHETTGLGSNLLNQQNRCRNPSTRTVWVNAGIGLPNVGKGVPSWLCKVTLQVFYELWLSSRVFSPNNPALNMLCMIWSVRL